VLAAYSPVFVETPTPLAFTQTNGAHGNANSLPAALREGDRPVGIFATEGGTFLLYKVREGDTLSAIAKRFKISVQTITAINPGVRARALQIGQELTILPVSGTVYTARGGETLEEIAESVGVSLMRLRELNFSLGTGPIAKGNFVVLPSEVSLRTIALGGNSLPDFPGYFKEPAEGFNWGKLHTYNAVDIAASCGTPVNAAAEGLVVDTGEGWNTGYGNYVIVEHPNGTETRYAHLQDVIASVGDYVKQGAQVGSMGNTGNVHGVTGCHLHFEVKGAQNPFAR
jgi:murein DD-endopeptidase MepM/ murein hydrolase activator NlpD